MATWEGWEVGRAHRAGPLGRDKDLGGLVLVGEALRFFEKVSCSFSGDAVSRDKSQKSSSLRGCQVPSLARQHSPGNPPCFVF